MRGLPLSPVLWHASQKFTFEDLLLENLQLNLPSYPFRIKKRPDLASEEVLASVQLSVK